MKSFNISHFLIQYLRPYDTVESSGTVTKWTKWWHLSSGTTFMWVCEDTLPFHLLLRERKKLGMNFYPCQALAAVFFRTGCSRWRTPEEYQPPITALDRPGRQNWCRCSVSVCFESEDRERTAGACCHFPGTRWLRRQVSDRVRR